MLPKENDKARGRTPFDLLRIRVLECAEEGESDAAFSAVNFTLQKMKVCTPLVSHPP